MNDVAKDLEMIFTEGGFVGESGSADKVFYVRDFRKIMASYRCGAEEVEEVHCSRYKCGLGGRCTYQAIEHGLKVCRFGGV